MKYKVTLNNRVFEVEVEQGEAMLDLMRSAGFEQCQEKRLTLGTCSIYTAVKGPVDSDII